MRQTAEGKSARLLAIFSRLQSGQICSRQEFAKDYGVTERSIQRDIESLRCFLSEQHFCQDIVYDHQKKGYRLINAVPHGLTNSEVLAVCKILLESRSLRKDEMFPILEKLVDCAVPKEQKKDTAALVANEKFHYIEPHHNAPVLDKLWILGQAVKKRQVVEIEYQRLKEPNLVKRRVLPVGIMFSEYYFYLTAFLEDKSGFENPDDLSPTIYRLDRIHAVRELNEHFHVPYKDRFEEGEFRKRVQFMYGGKLERIKFRYTGPSIEAVLDRLPTAQVIVQDENGWTIEAEVFGKGIEMWLRSQGAFVSVEAAEN